MKNSHLKYIFLLTVIVFISSADVYSQKKFMDSNQFWDDVMKARNSVGERKRSEETLEEEYLDGEVVFSTSTLYQYLANDNYRYYTKSMTTEGVTEEEETIRVGFFRYDRKNGSEWTKIDLRTDSGLGNGVGTGMGRTVLSQFTVEPVFLGSATTKMYERLEVMQDRPRLMTTESRYWVGQDGALLQVETVEASLSPRVIKSRRTVKYEYDPKIKIEAPIK